jgi:hypothetical protein
VLAPFLREHVGPPIQKWLGWLPFFQGTVTGIGLFTGGVILAIMVTPIITAVVRDVLAAVPVSQREAALALGATKWETTRVVLANGAPGHRGRDHPRTRARGRRDDGRDDGHRQPPRHLASLFEPSYTIASVIANEFTEATGDLYLSALVELGARALPRHLHHQRRGATPRLERHARHERRRRGMMVGRSVEKMSQTRSGRGAGRRVVNTVMTTLTAACAFLGVASCC